MNAAAITMDVRRVGETTAVVDIRGEVTAACEPVLMSAYEAAGGSATSRLVLNFGGLEYMNSGGIGMIVTLLVRANRQRQQTSPCLTWPSEAGSSCPPVCSCCTLTRTRSR
jgi:anti-sigma B factor antagonist